MSTREVGLDTDLRERIDDTVQELIPEGADCAVLGVPDYPNVGDSMIYLGQIAALARRGCQIRYVASDLSFSRRELAAAVPEGILLLQGGGNFGDLWPNLQEFRERVVQSAIGRRIVMFPQTVHLRDTSHMSEIMRIFEKHGDCYMLARDEATFDLLSAFDVEVRLCPDMAFAIDALPFIGSPSFQTVVMARTDKEVAATDRPVDAVDWNEKAVADYLLIQAGATANVPPGGARPRPALAEAAYRLHAIRRVVRGVTLLSRGEVLVADRLHAHVLAYLMGQPSVIVEDRTGKIVRVVKRWLPRDLVPSVCETFTEAISLASDLRRARPEVRSGRRDLYSLLWQRCSTPPT